MPIICSIQYKLKHAILKRKIDGELDRKIEKRKEISLESSRNIPQPSVPHSSE